MADTKPGNKNDTQKEKDRTITEFFNALEKGDVKTMQKWLAKFPQKVDEIVQTAASTRTPKELEAVITAARWKGPVDANHEDIIFRVLISIRKGPLHPEIITILLKHGAKATIASKTKGTEGWSPLAVAAMKGDGIIVQQLLQAGCRVEQRLCPRIPELSELDLAAGGTFTARTLRNLYRYRTYFQNIPVINTLPKNVENALWWFSHICRDDSKERAFAVELLSKYAHQHQGVVVRRNTELTALHYGMASGHAKSVSILLGLYGDDEMEKMMMARPNPLDFGCKSPVCVQLLLERWKGELSTSGNRVPSSLVIALRSGNPESVHHILERMKQTPDELKKECLYRDARNRSLLDLACSLRGKDGEQCLQEILLGMKAMNVRIETTAPCRRGLCPLALSLCRGTTAAFNLLIKHTEDPHEAALWRVPPKKTRKKYYHGYRSRWRAKPAELNIFNETPLFHFAVRHSRVRCMELLLECAEEDQLKIASIQHNITHESPMTMAARRGLKSIVRRLIDVGVDPRKKEDILVHAAKGKSAAVVKLLVDAGVSPKGEMGAHALFSACLCETKGKMEIASACALTLLELGAHHSCWSPRGMSHFSYRERFPWKNCIQTTLQAAARSGLVKVAEALLSHGAKVDGTTEKKEKIEVSPLTFACGFDHPGMVDLLLDHGAQMECLSSTAMSPLHAAVSVGALENEIQRSDACARLLLEHGAKTKVFNVHGLAPLHCARYASTVQILMKYGADVSIPASVAPYYTPLHVAVAVGCGTTYLLGNSKFAKTKDDEEGKVVQALLEGGAHIGRENSAELFRCALGKEQSAYFYLLSSSLKIIHWLLRYGIDPNTNYREGMTVRQVLEKTNFTYTSPSLPVLISLLKSCEAAWTPARPPSLLWLCCQYVRTNKLGYDTLPSSFRPMITKWPYWNCPQLWNEKSS